MAMGRARKESKAVTCRRLAQACIDVADRVDPKNRENLHRIAEMWLSRAAEELAEASRKLKQSALVG